MLMVYNGNVYMDRQDREDMMTLGAPPLPPDGPIDMWRAWGERALAEGGDGVEAIFRAEAVKGILMEIDRAANA